jgi:hypothetical protein
MPNRIIKESCRTSQTLDRLSAEAERFFWRLITVADDYGRFEADPRILLSACFPLKVQAIKLQHVEKWWAELMSAGLVVTYKSGEKTLAYFTTWEKHQQTRAKHSKYPEPTPDSICKQTQSDESNGNQIPAHVPVFESENRESRSENRYIVLPHKRREASISKTGENWPSVEALIKLYNDESPDECPAVQQISAARIEKARAYLRQFPEKQFWETVMQQIRASPFLRGLKKNRNEHESFKADFDWLLQKGRDGTENVVKVHDGKYWGQ